MNQVSPGSRQDDAPELLDLFATVSDETASTEQIERLEKFLLTDDGVVESFVHFMFLHALLERNSTIARPNSLLPSHQVVQPEPRAASTSFPANVFPSAAFQSGVGSFSSGWPLAYLIATVVVAVGLLVSAWIPTSRSVTIAHGLNPAVNDRALHKSNTRRGGRITGMVDCRWAEDGVPLRMDEGVPLGREIKLKSGLMEVTYDTGAKVILQGPVTYEVASPAGGFLSLGKLTARVDNAKPQAANQKSEIRNPKFVVRTPTATVNDLGTEFGVEVTDNNASVVHVFQGSIELHAMSGGKVQNIIRMVEHESARVERGAGGSVSAVTDATVRPSVFVRSERLQELILQKQETAFRRWKAHFEKLGRDPAVVAYYDFQRRGESPGVLHAVSNASQKPPHGTIQGPVWGTGRMPGKQSLRFDGNQDHVAINLPQRLTQMTLAASIAIELINDDQNSGSAGLLMSDGWGNPATDPEQCHWQILRPGEMCFSTVAMGRTLTPVVLPWHDWGRQRWRHLAVVVDPAQGNMTFYLDGEAVLKETVRSGIAATFGSARIGNWLPVKGHMPRAFCGRMDELLIMGRAMTADEIREMFEAGRR
jgi:hypothetical protein